MRWPDEPEIRLDEMTVCPALTLEAGTPRRWGVTA
jgi:hypothetical protein